MMIEAAAILAFGIVLAAYLRSRYQIKPRRALASVTIIGPTERGEETMQLVGTLFDDETQEEIDAKVKKLTEIMERRRHFCNMRMMEITKNSDELLEEAKKVVSEAGLKVVE
jgi:hypothetical protein